MSQFDPYQPPRYVPPEKNDAGFRPGVITWYAVYCVGMALLYVACAGFGVFFLMMAASANAVVDTETEKAGLVVQGIVFIIISLPLAILFLGGVFAPRRKWGWIYGIVTIGIGMTSCCLWPATIPLLIYWVKQETKDYYNVP